MTAAVSSVVDFKIYSIKMAQFRGHVMLTGRINIMINTQTFKKRKKNPENWLGWHEKSFAREFLRVCQTVYCFTMKSGILCGYCPVLGFVISSLRFELREFSRLRLRSYIIIYTHLRRLKK